MSEKRLRTQIDAAALMLRLGLAAIFIVHGYFKLSQNDPLIEDVSLSTQILIGWGELVAGGALVVGLLSRLAALGLVVLQVGAVIQVTGKYAFEGLTIGRKGADFTRVGPEYNLVLIVMALCVIVLGSGKASLDHCLVTWWRARKG